TRLCHLLRGALSGSPLDLRSLPTRRSSDLWHTILWGLIMALLSISLLLIGGLNVVQTSAVVVAVPVVIIYILLIISLMKWLKNRSEEHTSELQSRFDLVCRLLLEKQTTAPV